LTPDSEGSNITALISPCRVATAPDDALHHHHEHDLAFIPSAHPAHPPAVDVIAQDSRLVETAEAGLDLQFLHCGRRGSPELLPVVTPRPRS